MRELFNGGDWTPARFHSFIKSALRSASQRWPPKFQCLKDASVGKKINWKTGRMAMHFQCNRCKKSFPQKEIEVNHIIQVVPPEGFSSWDDVINRLFCEKEGLEAVCKPCHKLITAEEKNKRKEHTAEKAARKKEKNKNE